MLFLSRIDFPNMTENMGRKVKKKEKETASYFLCSGRSVHYGSSCFSLTQDVPPVCLVID